MGRPGNEASCMWGEPGNEASCMWGEPGNEAIVYKLHRWNCTLECV